MFRKLTYLMMLILIGVGSVFGQGVQESWTWNGSNIAALVTIDQKLLDYKATNSNGSVNVTINNQNYTTYETAIAAVYSALEANATAMPTNWGSTAQTISSGTVSVIKVNGNKNVTTKRTIKGTLVLVGSGTLTFTNATNGIIDIDGGSLFLQGNVVLDGNLKNRQRALVKGTNGGKLYMADNATIQNCINTSTTNLGGAVYLSGSNARFYMAGGVIGDENATMRGTKLPVMLDGYDDYTNCYWGYALSTGNKGNKAWMGGGVYLYGGASMFMNGGHISGNEATFNDPEGWGTECGGGGVFSNLSTVTIYGGEISYNLAIAGAGIHSCRPYATTGSSKATLNIYGGTFKWNCAATGLYNNYQNYNCGGAVFSYDSNLAVNGGKFTENRAPMGGGALYIYGGQSQAVIEDMEAYKNYTCWSGTVCMEAAGAEIRGGKFYENESYQGTIACYPVAGVSGTPTTTIGKNDGTGPEIYNNKVLFGIDLLGMGSDPYQDAYDALGVGGALYLNELNLDVKGGKIYGNEAAVAGGAVFIVDGNCTIEGGELGCSVLDEESGEYLNLGNKALGTSNASEQGLENFSPDIKGDGGGVYVYYTASASGKKTTISGSNTFIRYNEAERNGGGLFVADGEVNIEGGTFDGNKAKGTITASTGSNSDGTGNGGGMFVKSTIRTDMTGGTLINNVAANNGGGLYLKGAFDMDGGSFGTSASNGNIATAHDGGGVYVESGNLDVSNGTFSGNKAEAGNGGGFYVASGTVNLEKGTQTGAAIAINNANTAINGGGFYANGGNVTLKDANIASNVAIGDGGGVYSNGGKFTISNTSGFAGGILSNTAVNGGGGYVKGGTLEITGGNIDSNTATDGAGFFVDGGTLNLYGGTIGLTNGNVASNKGGGFYLKGGVANIKTDPNNPASSATVQYNNAVNGGGLYLEGTGAADDDNAIAYFENGLIQYNSADEAGGGIYIANYAKLDMSGTSQIIHNHVPAGKKGGGVFKSGQETSEIKVGGASLELLNNYAGNTYSDDVRNNLFLDGVMDYLTIKPDGLLGDGVKVGISIGSYIPTRVIKCTSFNVLNNIYMEMKAAYDNPETATTRVFDDAAKYEPLFAGEPSPFTWDYIFFIQTWDAVFEKVHKDFNPAEGISDATGLTYFMMIQNGIRCDEWMANHPGLDISDIKEMEVKLTGDIDLIGLEGTGDTLYWRPVSGDNASVPYKGKFDGKGHTITGMQTIDYINCSYYGMFGKTEGAEISNLFVQNCRTTSGGAKAAGMLIGQMNGGSVTNVVVSGIVDGSGSGESTTIYAEGNCNIGGLVGETEGGARITNCCASAHINAGFKKREGLSDKYYRDNRTAGGLVGRTSSGTVIENGFVNLSMIHGSWTPKPVGGLVGYNFGTISNCYVRWDKNEKNKDMIWLNQSPNSDAPHYEEYEQDDRIRSMFGLIVGEDDNGKISYCYMPDGRMINGSYKRPWFNHHDNSEFEFLGDYKPVERPYTYTSYLKDNQAKYPDESYGTGKETTLLSKLNSWVDDANNANRAGKEYSHWMRTKGSDVNGDYPILKYDNKDSYYPSVAGYHCYNDSVYLLEYNKDINEVLKRSNYFGKGCLFVYGQLEDSIKVNNGEGVKTFIDDDVPVLQVADSTLTNVYTCQTIKGPDRAWHLISSSLADSPTGFKYGKTTEVTWNEQLNPCNVNILTNSVDDYKTFFPSETTVDNIDLYNFYEPEYHWLNLKRNRLSHWHMDDHDWNIGYPEGYDYNDNLDEGSHLVPGRGYLAAIGLIPAKDTEAPEEFLLQAGGTLNNGDVTIAVTNLSNGYYGSELKGYNLLGNPYQSYLSFYKFTQDENNQKLWKQDEAPFYMVFDSENNTYKPGSIVVPSIGSEAASGEINMHQGFFIVKTGTATEAHFTNAMRFGDPASGTHFRGEAPAYPLVNLVVTDGNGVGDVAVVEFDRPEYQSAAKMKHIGADGKIYFHYNDEDHALLFLNEDIDQLPARFDAIENGTYTMTWSTANADFSYLHLIDNMTGMDIDMLTSEGYSFTASTDDYKSRFKLMFAYTGVEENEAAETETFAFMHDGNLTVNGEGWLEVIDMCGRTIASTKLTNAQNTMSLPQAAQGVYVLKLTSNNMTKVQKIVVE